MKLNMSVPYLIHALFSCAFFVAVVRVYQRLFFFLFDFIVLCCFVHIGIVMKRLQINWLVSSDKRNLGFLFLRMMFYSFIFSFSLFFSLPWKWQRMESRKKPCHLNFIFIITSCWLVGQQQLKRNRIVHFIGLFLTHIIVALTLLSVCIYIHCSDFTKFIDYNNDKIWWGRTMNKQILEDYFGDMYLYWWKSIGIALIMQTYSNRFPLFVMKTWARWNTP